MIAGYILLPKETSSAYSGIDRGLFEPLLIEIEFEQGIPTKQNATVSSFYPVGWRKTAYELYELNQVPVDDTFAILKDYEIASQIKDLIRPHLGEYEIFFTQIADQVNDFVQLEPCYGYDFAYPGGDYYSAIKNASQNLLVKFASHLNEHGLFNDPSLFENYIDNFKKEMISEADSSFAIFRLTKK